MEDSFSLSDKEFALFRDLISGESGSSRIVDSRVDALRAVIEGRIGQRKDGSWREYYDFLRSYPSGRDEIQELFSLITIKETYFFRNRPHFEALMGSVLPEIINSKICLPDRSVRIWSAGCSMGDEPYSLAIAVMETLPSYGDWNVSILATDLDRGVIEKAKEGVYSERAVSQLPDGYIGRYFEKRGKDYILDEKVKKLVRFELNNLVKDPFEMDGMRGLDIIFCRNVTIYFDLETTRKVVDKFYNCLADDGYLFIGHAETLWEISNKFEPIEFPQTFIYKKSLYPVGTGSEKPFMGIPEMELAPPAPLRTVEDISQREEEEKEIETDEKVRALYEYATKQFNKKKYEEALPLFDEVVSIDEKHAGAHFAKATILANQAKYEEAAGELAKVIEIDNLYAGAYYFLGVLFNKTGDLTGSEKQFKKCVYADPQMALAYYNLGNIHLHRKKFNSAVKEFSNAVKLLAKRPPEDPVEFCGSLTVEFLLRACEKNIEQITFLKKEMV